ncbi:hypothetical protein O988_02879 [Pseudogymnoascus sp. VKM F-3808]|nr:hypothetical protein O988_02879 [Pseudogymnoascus sp. VKM F-3808]
MRVGDYRMLSYSNTPATLIQDETSSLSLALQLSSLLFPPHHPLTWLGPKTPLTISPSSSNAAISALLTLVPSHPKSLVAIQTASSHFATARARQNVDEEEPIGASTIEVIPYRAFHISSWTLHEFCSTGTQYHRIKEYGHFEIRAPSNLIFSPNAYTSGQSSR